MGEEGAGEEGEREGQNVRGRGGEGQNVRGRGRRGTECERKGEERDRM